MKKIILLYPYFSGISGAYNRYLLLEKLIKNENIEVDLILLNDKKFNFPLFKLIFKSFRFFIVETLIFYYSIVKRYYLITDYNPSFIALISRKVIVQIHDVFWENKNYTTHNIFSYKLFLIFIKNYSRILTVSKTSMNRLKEISGREKSISFVYNSVTDEYIEQSNKIAKMINLTSKNIVSRYINFERPNIIYVATLTPRKSHLELLESLSRINNILNVNLIGLPIDKNIEKIVRGSNNLIKSNINYLPKIDQQDLCLLLLFSSAYISTSRYEGFGIPVLEAQLYNLPLIIRDMDINRELFPSANFFKTNIEFENLLNLLKPLSLKEIKERKKNLSGIKEDNLIRLFNYSELSKRLIDFIYN